MKTNYNVTGAERKALVQTISDHLGEKAKYRGMPSCAYLIGDFTVTKDGTLEFDDCTDSEIVEGLYEAIATAGFAIERDGIVTASESTDLAPLRTLAQEGLLKGWEEPVDESPAVAAEAATVAEEAAVQAQEDNGVEDDTEAQDAETTEDAATEAQDAPTEGAAPDALTISLPMTGHTVNSLRNLVTMIYSRGALLYKATGGRFSCPLEQVEVLKDCMTVEDAVAQITEVLVGLSITDDSLTFAFPATDDTDKVHAFTQLAVQMGKAALERKRVMAKEVDTTNEKYIFRIWLLSLGMGGDEFKTARRVLLAPLSGNAAFKDAAMEQRWKEKRAVKRACTPLIEEATEYSPGRTTRLEAFTGQKSGGFLSKNYHTQAWTYWGGCARAGSSGYRSCAWCVLKREGLSQHEKTNGNLTKLSQSSHNYFMTHFYNKNQMQHEI